MKSFKLCEHFSPFGGRPGASSDPRWARRLIENFAQKGGQGGLPLGNLPLWGREGGTLTTTTADFLNNSLIEEFSRAIISATWPAALFVRGAGFPLRPRQGSGHPP